MVRFVWLIAVLIAHGCAGSPPARQEQLVELLEGRYQGADATVANPGPGDVMTDTRLRVIAPKLGDTVIYWEVRTGAEQRPYRRILSVITPAGDALRQTSWRLRDGLEWPEPVTRDTFRTIGPDDVTPVLPEGCDSLWRATQDGWAAYMGPESCRVYSERRQQWRRIEAETIVTPAGLLQTERGFADDGRQLFGTAPDQYHELRRLDGEMPER